MSNGVVEVENVNPLSPGNDPNSVENAAAGFDTLFSHLEPDFRDDDGNPVNHDGSRREARPRRSEQRPQERIAAQNEDPAPDPDRDDDSQARKPAKANDPLRDPIFDLDGEEGDEEGEEEEASEEPDADEEGDEGEDDDSDIDMERELPVTVNGEVQNLKLSEIIAGYSRDADYRQKTAALAEERREVVEYAQEVVQERQKYATTLQTWLDATAALEPSQEDWEALKRGNPQAYIATRDQWEAISKKREAAKAELEEIAQRNTAEQQRQYREWVKAEDAKLLEKVPALRNEKKAKAFRDTIFKGARELGYSAEELASGAVDHRDVLSLYYASRYLEIQRSRKAGQRPPANAKRDPKPAPSSNAPPRVSGKTGQRVDRERAVRDADRRLARTGSVNDAALAFSEDLRRRR